ncbi:MAG: phospholipase [Planctomycetes bacterium]|nr:phospholipase [Planctomycetota bacterium]
MILSGCAAKAEVRAGQRPGVFAMTVTREVRMNYLLYLPKDYGKADKKWPLILFLHGAGERGSDLNLVKKHGPAKLVAEGKDFDFIIISPQCRQESWWPTMAEDLKLLVDDIAGKYQVDKSRMYITGLSMGGYGTWSMIIKYPDMFAAAAPICGGGDAVLAKFRLAKIPLWVFHGAKDNVVPLSKSEEMVKAVKAAGNKDIEFTIYPDAGHDSWTETYNNPELYKWFLNYEKK